MKKYSSILMLLFLSAGGLFFLPPQVAAGSCDRTTATPQKVTAVSGPKSGQVTLFWDAASYADRYAVVYGTVSNKYIYGARDIGGEKSRSYTVSLLTPGVRYYFRMAAAVGCNSSPFTAEVSAVAAGGVGAVAVAAPKVKVQASVPLQPSTPSSSVAIGTSVGKQHLTVMSGPKAGEATLYWQHADSADNYHLMYGTKPGSYQYGALNIGNVNKFTVRFLAPGTRYYFALVPLVGGRPLYTTGAVSGVARGVETEVVMTTPQALIMPKVITPVRTQTTPGASGSAVPIQTESTLPAGQ